jgi:hypothetical protein
MRAVENWLSSHRCGNDHLSLNLIFPFTNCERGSIENQFGARTIDRVEERFDRRFEERSGNVEALVFLWNGGGLEKLG